MAVDALDFDPFGALRLPKTPLPCDDSDITTAFKKQYDKEVELGSAPLMRFTQLLLARRHLIEQRKSATTWRAAIHSANALNKKNAIDLDTTDLVTDTSAPGAHPFAPATPITIKDDDDDDDEEEEYVGAKFTRYSLPPPEPSSRSPTLTADVAATPGASIATPITIEEETAQMTLLERLGEPDPIIDFNKGVLIGSLKPEYPGYVIWAHVTKGGNVVFSPHDFDIQGNELPHWPAARKVSIKYVDVIERWQRATVIKMKADLKKVLDQEHKVQAEERPVIEID